MSDMGYRVIVTGRVQGVCFRYSTAQEARKLNIVGHAKNLKDGSVEVLMYGQKNALQTLLIWLENGPSHAIVKTINIEEIEFVNKKGFITL